MRIVKFRPYVFQRKCCACELCVENCPQKVFGMMYKENMTYATVEYADRCIACNKCIKVCPAGAIEVIIIQNRNL